MRIVEFNGLGARSMEYAHGRQRRRVDVVAWNGMAAGLALNKALRTVRSLLYFTFCSQSDHMRFCFNSLQVAFRERSP